MSGPSGRSAIHAPGTLPQEAFTGYAGDGFTRPAGIVPVAPTAAQGVPLPQTIITPWAPPGIELPWPKDEYLHDGGDQQVQATVASDYRVGGLEPEDTIVHYDTIDGRTVVEPSNRVHIYAPRFGAVRKVESLELSRAQEESLAVALPVRLQQEGQRLLATTAVQPVQPRGEVGAKQPSISRQSGGAGRVSNRVQLAAEVGALLPFEDLSIIRMGIFEDAEMPYLAQGTARAIAWTHDQAVQIILDRQQAQEVASDQRIQTTYTVDVPNHPKLRVIKIASKQTAKPGEDVDFTIRFDNVGDQVIGNVTLIDNLTTRLELVEGSAQSSRKAEFSTQPNEAESLVLRWDFEEPLKAGEGGLVRFHCRVR